MEEYIEINGEKYVKLNETNLFCEVNEEEEFDMQGEVVIQERTPKRIGIRVLKAGHPDNKYNKMSVVELSSSKGKILIGKSGDLIIEALRIRDASE